MANEIITKFDAEIRPELQRYIDAHEQGIPKLRNQALDSLIECVQSLSPERKSAIQEQFCRILFDQETGFSADTPIPIQFPLLRDLLVPYLTEAWHQGRMPQVRWLARSLSFGAQPTDEQLARLSREEFLNRALELDPSDEQSWVMLAAEHIEVLDWATHHVPDAMIMNEAPCQAAVDALHKIFENSSAAQARYLQRCGYYERLLEDWAAYEKEVETGSFLQWCRVNNKNYDWVTDDADVQE